MYYIVIDTTMAFKYLKLMLHLQFRTFFMNSLSGYTDIPPFCIFLREVGRNTDAQSFLSQAVPGPTSGNYLGFLLFPSAK